jgi:hypothetical protein
MSYLWQKFYAVREFTEETFFTKLYEQKISIQAYLIRLSLQRGVFSCYRTGILNAFLASLMCCYMFIQSPFIRGT